MNFYNEPKHEALRFIRKVSTGGGGLWSDAEKDVSVEELVLVEYSPNFGELRVYFNSEDWDVEDEGLIYTDKKFLKELRYSLGLIGLVGEDVDYSEQGMQGDDYVSLDVGKKFIDSWNAIRR